MFLPRITTRRWMIAVGVVAVLLVAVPWWLQRDRQLRRLARERYMLASVVYDDTVTRFLGGEAGISEVCMRSRRILDAQADIGDAGAVVAHLQRLTRLKQQLDAVVAKNPEAWVGYRRMIRELDGDIKEAEYWQARQSW